MAKSALCDSASGQEAELPSAESAGSDFKHIIEALLFVADEPLSAAKIAQAVTGLDARQVRRLIDQLCAEYQAEGRAFTIEELAGGFRLLTRAEFHPYLKVLFRQPREIRLSSAALETLAIIAYKQPVNRAEIERLRGVDSSGVLERLLEARLVKIVGRSEELGRPLLYGTTADFLEHFGLKSIRDLPTVPELVAPDSAVVAPPSPSATAGKPAEALAEAGAKSAASSGEQPVAEPPRDSPEVESSAAEEPQPSGPTGGSG